MILSRQKKEVMSRVLLAIPYSRMTTGGKSLFHAPWPPGGVRRKGVKGCDKIRKSAINRLHETKSPKEKNNNNNINHNNQSNNNHKNNNNNNKDHNNHNNKNHKNNNNNNNNHDNNNNDPR